MPRTKTIPASFLQQPVLRNETGESVPLCPYHHKSPPIRSKAGAECPR